MASVPRSVSRRGRRPFPASVFEERRARVAPLFAYLEEHNIMAQPVARLVSIRTGYPTCASMLSAIKRGACCPPITFIEEMCREIGHSVAEVMGTEWCATYGYVSRDMRDTRDTRDATDDRADEPEMSQAS